MRNLPFRIFAGADALRVLALWALLCTVPSGLAARRTTTAQPPTSGVMQVYPTKYYIIHTDLPTDDVKEAVIRMTRMAEEYHARTQGFSGEITQRLPFFLFKNADDYYAAGGLPGSAGVFNGSALMAIAGDQTNGETWHVVQHEGFHQFAHAVIRGELPTWVNEGIAEYFGESLFTGDGFVTGIIPPDRLRRLQNEIKSGRLKSIRDMMLTGQEQWNSRLTIENYDQAWSMVHFLAQGENGKYQEPFVNFMRLIGRGTPWAVAWKSTFGDAVGFEQRWKDYWLNLPPNPTAHLYARAVTAALTSYLARAEAQKQGFDNFDEFLATARKGDLKVGQTLEDWLPPKLLKDVAEAAKESSVRWSLVNRPGAPAELVAELPDGTRIVSTYDLRAGHVSRVNTDVDDTATIIKDAQGLIADGKKDKARALLQSALRAHPKSPLIEDVRKLIVQTK